LDFLPLLGYKINLIDNPDQSSANSANQGTVNAKFDYEQAVCDGSLVS